MNWYGDIRAAGYLPQMLSEADPRRGREQFNTNYAFGGWAEFEGFELSPTNELLYPGDPPMHPLAWTWLRDELICVYPHAWVAIIQPDRSFTVARLD